MFSASGVDNMFLASRSHRSGFGAWRRVQSGERRPRGRLERRGGEGGQSGEGLR